MQEAREVQMRRTVLLGVVLLVVLCFTKGAASRTLVNDDFERAYSFWRGFNNTNQYYALGTQWGEGYLDIVTELVASNCSQYVTKIDSPFKKGWHVDHLVRTRGFAKGLIFSRNATGSTEPDAAAESCITDVFNDTFPTAGVVGLALFMFFLGGWIVVLLAIAAVGLLIAGVLYAVGFLIAGVLFVIWVCLFQPVIFCGKWLVGRFRSKKVAADPSASLEAEFKAADGWQPV